MIFEENFLKYFLKPGMLVLKVEIFFFFFNFGGFLTLFEEIAFYLNHCEAI